LVEIGHFSFGIRPILIRGLAIPGESLLVIALDAVVAALVRRAQIELGGRIALVVVGWRQFRIARHTEAMLVHGAKLILGGA